MEETTMGVRDERRRHTGKKGMRGRGKGEGGRGGRRGGRFVRLD